MRVWRLALHTRVRVFTLSTQDIDERQSQDYGAPQITAEISQLWHYSLLNAYGQLFLLVPAGIKLSSTFVFDSFAEDSVVFKEFLIKRVGWFSGVVNEMNFTQVVGCYFGFFFYVRGLQCA